MSKDIHIDKGIHIDMEQQFGHEWAQRNAERGQTVTYSLVAEKAERREQAEDERDIALFTALHNAQRSQEAEFDRDWAFSLAIEEAAERRQAERMAVQARMAEQQAQTNAAQLAAERTALRENLASEREVASNASFGFIFLACLIVAAFIGLGFWYGNVQKTAEAQNANATMTAMNTRANNAAMTKPPIIIQNPAPVVVTQPPRVIIKEVPAPKPATTRVNGEEIENGAPVNVPASTEAKPAEETNPASESANPSGNTKDSLGSNPH